VHLRSPWPLNRRSPRSSTSRYPLSPYLSLISIPCLAVPPPVPLGVGAVPPAVLAAAVSAVPVAGVALPSLASRVVRFTAVVPRAVLQTGEHTFGVGEGKRGDLGRILDVCWLQQWQGCIGCLSAGQCDAHVEVANGGKSLNTALVLTPLPIGSGKIESISVKV